MATRTAPGSATKPRPGGGPVSALARLRAVVRHEWTVVSAAALGLAAVITWPTLRHPMSTVPEDLADPLQQAWQVAWGGHALLTDPAHLWNANSFFPLSRSYAFSDTLLGYAPLGMIGSGPEAALLRYNLLYVLLHALAFVGAYALARQLGARWPGAAVAGAAFAYAPWRLSHGGHMNILSTGGMALALAMLARGHGWSLKDGYRPERVKPGWALAGWVTAAWQISLGFATGLVFVYVLLVIGLVGAGAWLTHLIQGRPMPIARRLLLFDLAGGLFFTAVCLVMVQPYLKVIDEHPNAVRTEADVALFSPPLRGFFTAPSDSWLWGPAHESLRASLSWPPEMTRLPGMVLIALAAAGLFFSIWSRRQRVFLGVGAAVTTALAMGTQFFGGDFGYLLLYRYLPGWDGMRTPGRLTIWLTLLLAILAAGAVSRFTTQRRRAPLALLPVLLVLVEGLNTTPHPRVEPQPSAMHDVAGPVMVLPSGGLDDQRVMLWSTDGFPRTVNGATGFTPQLTDEIRKRSEVFPAASAVDYLRGLGVKTVVVLPDKIAGTPWAAALTTPVTDPRVRRRIAGSAVVFTLS